jgi:hypothetical protein
MEEEGATDGIYYVEEEEATDGIDDVEEEGATGGIYDVRKKELLVELIMRRRKRRQIIWDRKSY